MRTQPPKIWTERVYLPTETLGSMYMDGLLLCKTMELPWRNNQRSTTGMPSCIPEGKYWVDWNAPKPTRDYEYFRFRNVPGRSGILIHRITFVKDLLGCIGVGSKFHDFNKDGVPDMAGSKDALEYLVSVLPKSFEMEIKKKEA